MEKKKINTKIKSIFIYNVDVKCQLLCGQTISIKKKSCIQTIYNMVFDQIFIRHIIGIHTLHTSYTYIHRGKMLARKLLI
jgi:hypothetical protein